MTKLILSSILWFFFLFLPAASRAAPLGIPADKSPLRDSFCGRLVSFSSRVQGLIASRENQSLIKETERQESILGRRARQDDDRAALHARQDTERSALYTSLRTRAGTPAAEEAVERFVLAVDEAYRVRRETVRLATQVYRAEVDRILIVRSDVLEKAFQDLRATVEDAFQDAETVCMNSSSGANVRTTTVRDGLRTALERFRSFRGTLEALGDNHRSAQTTRDAALKEVVQTFRATITRARENLRSSF